MNTVIFEASRNGGVMIRYQGKVAFPDKRGVQPNVGDEYEVLSASPNPTGTVYFLSLGKKVEYPIIRVPLCIEHGSMRRVQKWRHLFNEESYPEFAVNDDIKDKYYQIAWKQGLDKDIPIPLDPVMFSRPIAFPIPKEEGAIYEVEVMYEVEPSTIPHKKPMAHVKMFTRLLRRLYSAEEAEETTERHKRKAYGGFIESELISIVRHMENEMSCLTGYSDGDIAYNTEHASLQSREQVIAFWRNIIDERLQRRIDGPRILLEDVKSALGGFCGPGKEYMRDWHTQKYRVVSVHGVSLCDIYAAKDATEEEIHDFIQNHGIQGELKQGLTPVPGIASDDNYLTFCHEF